MPGAELLQQLCVGLVEHIEQRDHSYSSILPALRTLALLMDHNYGFYHVKWYTAGFYLYISQLLMFVIACIIYKRTDSVIGAIMGSCVTFVKRIKPKLAANNVSIFTYKFKALFVPVCQKPFRICCFF